jgi:hypothetical protein
MAKTRGPFSTVISLLVWISGVLVSLAVGFAMTTGGVLNNAIPGIHGTITSIAGWIVVVLTLLSVLLVIIEKLR